MPMADYGGKKNTFFGNATCQALVNFRGVGFSGGGKTAHGRCRSKVGEEYFMLEPPFQARAITLDLQLPKGCLLPNLLYS